MVMVGITPEYDAKLRQLITDFGQTREGLVQRLIDEELARKSQGEPVANGVRAPKLRLIDGHFEKDLSFTRIVSASFGGRELPKPNWNSLSRMVHLRAFEELGSYEELARVSTARLRAGKYEQDGYKYISEGKFSLGGQSAYWSWQSVLSLAKALDRSVRIEFEWRDTEGAAHPGERGLLEWKGSR